MTLTVKIIKLRSGRSLIISQPSFRHSSASGIKKSDAKQVANLEKSEALFRNLETKYRLNSYEGEIKKTNYIKINNTDLLPEQSALFIKNKFSL